MKKLYDLTKKEMITNIAEIEPVEALNLNKVPTEVVSEYEQIGKTAVANGELAVVTMAGRTGNKTAEAICPKVHLK